MALPLSSCGDSSQASKRSPECKPSGLRATLYGSPSVSPPAEIWLFVASSAYPQFKRHPDPKSEKLVIGSAGRDVQKIDAIGKEFKGGIEQCYYIDHSKYSPATVSNVLEGLGQRSGEMPGFVYIALHRNSGGPPGFMAADYPKKPGDHSEYVILDVEIRSIILASLKPGTKPLFLLTEACKTDNFMELPYYLECENAMIIREEIEECKKHDWNSRPPVIHISATNPKHDAAHFTKGAVFTRAFNNLFKKPIKLEELVKALQAEVDEQLQINAGGNQGGPIRQQIRLYYSTPEALQADTLWSFVNFELRPETKKQLN